MATAALRARIAHLDGQIRALSAERDALVSELEETATFPILTLPPEITAEIFLRCLDDSLAEDRQMTFGNAPLILLLVCKAWADVARSTPRLWRALKLNFMYDEWYDMRQLTAVVREWPTMCREMPLEVHIVGASIFPYTHRFMAALQPMTGHIVTLVLRLDEEDLEWLADQRLELDNLQVLRLSRENRTSSGGDRVDIKRVFVKTPRLREVRPGRSR